MDSTAGYDIVDVVEIVKKEWFFGFMSAEEAKKILSTYPYGTYLFRFSSKAGQYALSVNYGQIGHWRITAEKISASSVLFYIDEKSYRSLDHVISSHKVDGQPLVIKGGPLTGCYLKFPVDRNVIYQAPQTLYEHFWVWSTGWVQWVYISCIQTHIKGHLHTFHLWNSSPTIERHPFDWYHCFTSKPSCVSSVKN